MFGVLNGLGAAATRAYGDILRATIGHQRLRAYLKNRTVRLIAIVITLHYVCVCQLFFANDVDRALNILRAGHVSRAVCRRPSSYSWPGPALVLAVAATVPGGTLEIRRRRLVRRADGSVAGRTERMALHDSLCPMRVRSRNVLRPVGLSAGTAARPLHAVLTGSRGGRGVL